MARKTCPKCGLEGPIKTHFGEKEVTRWRGGKHKIVKPQSHCRYCRGRVEPILDTLPGAINVLRSKLDSREDLKKRYIQLFPLDTNNTKRSYKYMLTKVRRREGW